MNVLLDTHVWLWMTGAPDRLSAKARRLVESAENDLYLSAASAWEIAIKYALGRLELPEPPSTYLPSRQRSFQVRALPIEIAHAARVGDLPPHHADPFDRMLVAQAQIEGLPILTTDRAFASYDVTTIKA